MIFGVMAFISFALFFFTFARNPWLFFTQNCPEIVPEIVKMIISKFFLKFFLKLSKRSKDLQENLRTKQNYSKYFPFRFVSFIPSMIFGVMAFISGALVFLHLPETLGYSLPEIVLKLFPKLSMSR